ncbi:MAG: HEAT repeat domain-containing protein [Acidobacteria bacterium]|nr:HEAT repeat domain-containing protein [Acidobacteriota bacterium]
MSSPQVVEPLAPPDATWLLDFARMCRAAARAVSLYPPEHPAIATSLDRLVRVCQAYPADGVPRMWVFPEGLRLNQRKLAQPDVAVGELAEMLRERRVGELTILPGVTVDNWRLFLSVLARAADDLAAHGGFGRVWTTSGGQLIELKEIDYSELLKERPEGQDASWDVVFQQFLQGGLQFDEAALKVVLEATGEPARLAELIAAIHARAAEQMGTKSLGVALARMLDGAMKLVPSDDPGRLTPVVQNMAAAVSQLPPDTLVAILTADRRGEAGLSSDLRQALVANMPDAAIADFVSRAVVEEGGASARLVEAFQVLAPDLERQRALLSLARSSAASKLGDDQNFGDLWQRVEDLLVSYSDRRYVSAEYGVELTRAQQRPSSLDATVDPPERVASWLGTVADDEVKELDHQLVVDLLRVEDDPTRWADLMPIVTGHATALVGLGRLEPAVHLVQSVIAEAKADESPRHRDAAAALDRLSQSEFVTGIAGQIHLANDDLFAQIKQMFRAMGSPVIRPLAETLAKEQRNPVRLRLRDALLGFGAVGRHSVEQLKKSPDPEVRRTAVHLLREFGGQEALPDLASLLDDSEPHVQREATRAILFIGTPDAYATLAEALRSGSAGVRDMIMGIMTTGRDEAVVPLFCYIVTQAGPSGHLLDVYRKSLEMLGEYGGDPAVEALRHALYRGEWWAPFRTAGMRSTAARALGRIGSPAARAVLQDAVATGPRRVRAAARPYAGRRT